MDLLEVLLIWALLTVMIFCFFMAVLTAANPKTQPQEIKINKPEQTEIHIIIQTVPADAGVQQE